MFKIPHTQAVYIGQSGQNAQYLHISYLKVQNGRTRLAGYVYKMHYGRLIATRTVELSDLNRQWQYFGEWDDLKPTPNKKSIKTWNQVDLYLKKNPTHRIQITWRQNDKTQNGCAFWHEDRLQVMRFDGHIEPFPLSTYYLSNMEVKNVHTD